MAACINVYLISSSFIVPLYNTKSHIDKHLKGVKMLCHLKELKNNECNKLYNQTCLKRPLTGLKKCGLLKHVASSHSEKCTFGGSERAVS